MTQNNLRPPTKRVQLAAAVDECRNAKNLADALEMLRQINNATPESIAAMWYRNNMDNQRSYGMLERRLPRNVELKALEKDLKDAYDTWKGSTPYYIFREYQRRVKVTSLDEHSPKQDLLNALADELCDGAGRYRRIMKRHYK